MKVIADLEVHSKYSRAVSSSMTLANIAYWAAKKGINLIGTGDFTQPLWFRELEKSLDESAYGIYRLKDKLLQVEEGRNLNFVLSAEVSCNYTDKGKGRRVHLIILLPKLSHVRQFNQELTRFGCNLFSDGRPMIGLSLAQVAEISLEVSNEAILIPAHVWTPWYGFYGANSGYNSLKEAFGDLERYIPAIETGLSSDPSMNWRIEELNSKRIVSFGDAHSPQKLGREATVFEISELSYNAIRKALWGKEPEKISYTIEFYPEEGKYHYTGHRNCKVIYSPDEVREKGLTCPVCGKPLTLGVMSRVEILASLDTQTENKFDEFGVRWIWERGGKRPPFVMLVPLLEILSESFSAGSTSQKVVSMYDLLLEKFGSEFAVLLNTPFEELEKVAGKKIVEALERVRAGNIVIEPGYDGVFGEVKIWSKDKFTHNTDQETLF